jgi:hypothetical protein
MTESDWLTCTEPQAMLDFLRSREGVTERKLRLFACACSHPIMHIPPEGKSIRHTIDAAERYADLRPTEEQSIAAARHIGPAFVKYPWLFACGAAKTACEWASFPSGTTLRQLATAIPRANLVEAAAQAALLRCFFGNPLRPPPPIDAAWLTSGVLSLANGIYERRAFEHLQELVSLLEDAGCTNEELLAHLHGPGPHARGCHVLDILLDKP